MDFYQFKQDKIGIIYTCPAYKSTVKNEEQMSTDIGYIHICTYTHR